MAEHTLPECSGTCSAPLSCCSPDYCEIAIEHAKSKWGIDLIPTSNPDLPLMGENGCIAEPHLRPLCAIHTCQVNSLGCKPGDVGWTNRYFQLREEIESIE